MKININEFRIDKAQSVEAPLDFATLCALIAEHQAATPTARLALSDDAYEEPIDPVHPAVAVLLSGPGQPTAMGNAQGSFHAAAAALFSGRAR